jgi:hypothetical protein
MTYSSREAEASSRRPDCPGWARTCPRVPELAAIGSRGKCGPVPNGVALSAQERIKCDISHNASCGRGGQHERRQQGPGMVLSAAQRLQGIFESAVRGGEQSRKVLGPLHGAGGRRQVRTGRNASLERSGSPSPCLTEVRLDYPNRPVACWLQTGITKPRRSTTGLDEGGADARSRALPLRRAARTGGIHPPLTLLRGPSPPAPRRAARRAWLLCGWAALEERPTNGPQLRSAVLTLTPGCSPCRSRSPAQGNTQAHVTDGGRGAGTRRARSA